jgi:hypothetical protein
VVALEEGIEPATFRDWLIAHQIQVLNVAGPRASKRPGVYAAAVHCLEALLCAALPRESPQGLAERTGHERRAPPPDGRGRVVAETLGSWAHGVAARVWYAA